MPLRPLAPSSALPQFHGDPHPGNIFCLRDGRIAYVDFGNVAQLSQQNKQVLVDAVVHAVNEDYQEMAGDFIKLGFLTQGSDVRPIIPALEKIWKARQRSWRLVEPPTAS